MRLSSKVSPEATNSSRRFSSMSSLALVTSPQRTRWVYSRCAHSRALCFPVGSASDDAHPPVASSARIASRVDTIFTGVPPPEARNNGGMGRSRLAFVSALPPRRMRANATRSPVIGSRFRLNHRAAKGFFDLFRSAAARHRHRRDQAGTRPGRPLRSHPSPAPASHRAQR